MLGYNTVKKYVGDLDQAFADHLHSRANAERQSALTAIKERMQSREGNPATVEQIKNAGYGDQMEAMYADPLKYGSAWHAVAEDVRAQRPGYLPGFEQAAEGMANSRLARYGVMAGAGMTVPAVGAGLTAGAQKLQALMGMLEETEEAEAARDQPLTS